MKEKNKTRVLSAKLTDDSFSLWKKLSEEYQYLTASEIIRRSIITLSVICLEDKSGEFADIVLLRPDGTKKIITSELNEVDQENLSIESLRGLIKEKTSVSVNLRLSGIINDLYSKIENRINGSPSQIIKKAISLFGEVNLNEDFEAYIKYKDGRQENLRDFLGKP